MEEDQMVFADGAELRLVLSRRLRDALVAGLEADGATPSEVEEARGTMMEVAAELVDRMGISLVDGHVVVRPVR